MLTAPDPTDRGGLLLAMLAASGLGLAVAVSRLAYEGGTNAITVATTRGWLAVLVVGAFCLLSGRELRLPRQQWLHCLGLGALMSLMFYGNIAAVQYIPVGLAALLFYTYPPMVALLQAALERRAPPLAKAVTLGAAFAGLALMLGVSLGSADPRGLALSLLAAAATAWNAVWMASRLRGVDPVVATFHMAKVAAVVLLALLLASGDLRWPSTSGGWVGLTGVAVLQSVSLPFYFIAIVRVGAMKSAMLSNVQPLVSIAAAYLLFGELLGASQIVGGLIVLGAILVTQQLDSRALAGAARRGGAVAGPAP